MQKYQYKLMEEFSYICLYIAAFGFSDYIVEYFGLKKYKYLLFYTIILLLGIFGLYLNTKYNNYMK